MESETDKRGGLTTGLPFVRPVVREIIEELFRAQTQWKSGALVDRVVQVHRQRGGCVEKDPSFTIKRVLQDLKDHGLVTAPGHGWWRWIGIIPESHTAPTVIDSDTAALRVESSDGSELALRPEKELGGGPECVYLYFNPNDRRLAELEGRDVWECKIGRTGSHDAIHRIAGQGVRTALSRMPTVALILRTHDSAALESALHASLRLIGAEVPESPGNEWFITSPARIEAWFSKFESALEAIKLAPT